MKLYLRLHNQLSPTNDFICKQTFAAQEKEGIVQQLVYPTNILGYLPLHYSSFLPYVNISTNSQYNQMRLV